MESCDSLTGGRREEARAWRWGRLDVLLMRARAASLAQV